MQHLAIDAGQSGVRARVLHDGVAESERASVRVGTSSGVECGGVAAVIASRVMLPTTMADVETHRGIRTDRPLPDQIVDTVSDIVGLVGTIDVVAVGLSGYTGSADLGRVNGLRRLGVRTLLIAHDSITSYLGALGTAEGAVIASGTGAVTLAVGPTAVARVDGWGNVMGDMGSGYWFGRAALTAAMRAYDGRGPKTILLDRLREEFGDVEGAYIELQSDPSHVRRTASFSRWVTQAEAEGDEVAVQICQRGAAELALSVDSGLDRVDIDPAAETSVSTIGGMFRSEIVARTFATELRARRPAIRHVDPRGYGLDGAAALFALDPKSVLGVRVTRIDLA